MYPIDKFFGDMGTVSDRLEKDGYTRVECEEDDAHIFCAYRKGDEGVFVNHFKATGQTQVVSEKDCNYFSFFADDGDRNTAAQITQLHLEDFGMAYVIRLEDGRFIVIDGGWGFEPDVCRLYQKLSENGKPTIALWIMTHPHCDHFHAIFPFYEKYADDVKIERFMFNFPDADDTEHYPTLATPSGIYDLPETEMIPRFLQLVKKIGAPVYRAHTGQIYEIGGAKLEIIASLDDTYGVTQSVNST